MQNYVSLLPSLLIACLACVTGFLVAKKIFAKASLKTYLSFGVVIGLGVIAWVGFLLALLCGLNWLSIGLTIVILCVVGFFFRPSPVSFQRPNFNFYSCLYYGSWIVFFSWLFGRVISIEPDGLYTAPANNYGDLGFHFSVVTSFADGDNFPPHNPIYQGLKFTYPFLIDFLSAFFHRAGADWATSFFIPNLILALALVGLIEILTEKLTQNILAARIAPVLFFFSGGAGFLYALRDKFASQLSWLDFVLHLPQSYTKNDPLNLQWGNMLTTLLVPQRSLLFGFPVFAMIVILWWEALGEREMERKSDRKKERFSFASLFRSFPPSPRRFFLFAGILTGSLPLLHAHGFFSVIIVSAVMALVFFSWDWLAFFVPAGILSLPQALWLSGTGTRSSLFKLNFGWAHGESPMLKFYAINFGIFLVALAIALVFTNARARRFYWPFLLCWIVPNVVLLAPWSWDNIKVLAYWFLLSVPFIAFLLAKILQSKKLYFAPLALVLFVMLTLSGALDVFRGMTSIERVQLFGVPELHVAELIKQKTPPHALMLCAPIHNSVLALTGRQMLMGYPGHLWSHGINFEAREKEIRAIFKGEPEAEDLLQKNNVDYVVISAIEILNYEANGEFFAEKFPLVIEAEGFRVYNVKEKKQ